MLMLRPTHNIFSPWREMEDLQREMNRLFDTALSPGQLWPSFPAMNLWTSKDGVVITAELPGVDIEDIDISVTNDLLTLSGDREADEAMEGARYHRQERGHGQFNRTIQLPFPVDADQVGAVLKNGVLSLSLPRAQDDRPRKIMIKSS